MAKYPPLEAVDIRNGLKAAGFELRTQKASHEQWILDGEKNGKKFRYKVTVDGHHAPFSQDLVSSMANQAGMSKKQFYELCCKDGTKKAKKGKLSWLKHLLGQN